MKYNRHCMETATGLKVTQRLTHLPPPTNRSHIPSKIKQQVNYSNEKALCNYKDDLHAAANKIWKALHPNL